MEKILPEEAARRVVPECKMYENQKIVRRPDFEDAPDEKSARLYFSRVSIFLQQQTTDQVAGKNKKDIYAMIAKEADQSADSVKNLYARMRPVEVKGHHHEDGNTANKIQLYAARLTRNFGG